LTGLEQPRGMGDEPAVPGRSFGTVAERRIGERVGIVPAGLRRADTLPLCVFWS
jgi:hypothetical protein